MIKGNFFFIDINTTTRCNLRCKYCIEPFKVVSDFPEEMSDVLIKRVEEMLRSSFIESYAGVNLCFWGGEPSTNPKTVLKIIEKFKDEDRVRFLIYSNGYRIDSLKDILLQNKEKKSCDGSPKVFYQISYDGNPAHDLNRLSASGKTTSSEVRETITWAKDNGIPYSIKSTINRETFKFLDQCYEDIKEISGEGGSYFPTIDYLTEDSCSPEQEDVFKEDLESALLRLSEKEVDFHKKHGRFFFSWFNGNRSLCSAGAHGIAIDTDGNAYQCHGIFYSDKKEENLVANINSVSFLSDIELNSSFHKTFLKKEPEECQKCPAIFCLRCNSMKYEISEKEDYVDRWVDYANQPQICSLYQLSTNIKLALDLVIKETK